MAKTIEEINDKIKKGRVVVVTAEEAVDLVKTKGVKEAAQEVDVVTTGTFAPMCSSGAYFNLKQSVPRMKLGGGWVTLNDVPAYAGLAAADIYLGANALPEDAPKNRIHPGLFKYGGAHVIFDLVSGQKVNLVAEAYGTDCYPLRERRQKIGLEGMNDAVMFNPRNGYQNYAVAVNLSETTIYTYMGLLQPELGNANYCSAGQLSPLLKDPFYRTIGLGTAVFLCGAVGYVVWPGTQHNPNVPRLDNGVPVAPAGTLALIGNLKEMSPQWLRPLSLTGYGVSLAIALGVPLPVLDEEVMAQAARPNEELMASIIDYSEAQPQGTGEVLGRVSYAELFSGSIEFRGKKIPTGSLSSYARARQVAGKLKEWIEAGRFTITRPVAPLPGAAWPEES
ncbi:MAG: homocysteine biosynthesis protein [Deltaproteobacteria bacterium]|nr:homocysteine biosynthesis protein [Deltaproteobacteria bacterium]